MQQKLNTQDQDLSFMPLSFWNPPFVPPPFRLADFRPFGWDNDIFSLTRRNMELVSDLFLNFPMLPAVQPTAKINEDDRSLHLKMDVAGLPGLKAEDINISAENGVLTISADKQENKNGAESHYSFSHSVSLPDNADIGQADVNFSNDRLSIDIPKTNGLLKKNKTPAISQKRRKKNRTRH